MHIPETPAELDAAWLEEALAKTEVFQGVRILAVEARVIGVGYGLDGVVARLALETEGGSAATPSSLVVKFARGERGRDEIAFYERIAARMPVRLPRYYAGHVVEADDRALLFLEDLTGAIQGDTVSGASRAQAAAVMTAMARFHAAFHGAADEDLAYLPVWKGLAAGLASRLEDRMARFLERYAERIDQRALAHIRTLARRLPEVAGVLEASTPTLVHTDLHVDNVLFLEGDRPVILDWPHACRGPAMIDVVRFFVEGTSVEIRRRHGAALLETYRRERERAGAGLPPPDRTAREYEAAVIWFLAHAAAWAGAEDPGFETPRVREIVDTLVRSTTAAAIDL